MAYIKIRLITISLHNTYAVITEQSGQVHYSVHVLLFCEIEQRNFKALTAINIHLPSSFRGCANAYAALLEMCITFIN
ncbi:hypothetical protein DDR56_13840 [Halomonas venusta]|uniref:Uncharacterized protein n=1 Tax=Vreelandella venusta TaxID=44935 RepID=A0ABX2BC07_9GAMM|nr:hypothetical protein [Halomonas venusta]